MPGSAFYSSNMSLDRAKDLVKGSLKALNIGGSVDHKDTEYREPILASEAATAAAQKHQGWTPLLVLAGVVTTFGSCVPVGYNIGVMNTPAHIIKQFCNDSVTETYGVRMTVPQLSALWSVIVSVFLVGGVTGSLTGGWVADCWGRKMAVVLNNVLGIVAAVLFVAARPAGSVEMLVLGRIIVGLSSGLVTTTVPMYLTEISPISKRGAMGVMCPIGITVGVLLGQVVGLDFLFGSEETWHFLLGLYSVLIVVTALGVPFLPESPKYLYVIRGEQTTAIVELCRLRGVRQAIEIESEVRELAAGRATLVGPQEWGAVRVLGSSALRLPLLLVCALQFGQQCSGINAVFYYSVTIFESAGLSRFASQLATIGAGFVNLAVTVLAVPLLSQFGRRPLVLGSCWLAAACLVLLAVAITFIHSVPWMPHFCIFAVLAYVFCYGLGLGPIPYFIGSELFETGPRPIAMAFGSMSNWGGNFVIGMTFPLLQSAIGQYSFLLFAFTTVLLSLLVKRYLPETKGTSCASVADMLKYGFRSKIYELHSGGSPKVDGDGTLTVTVLPPTDDCKVSLSVSPSHHALPSIPEKLADLRQE